MMDKPSTQEDTLMNARSSYFSLSKQGIIQILQGLGRFMQKMIGIFRIIMFIRLRLIGIVPC